MRVRELAEWLGATYEGDGEKELTGAAPLDAAGGADLAFIGNRKAAGNAGSSAAGCLLVPPEWPSPSYRTVIRVPEPRTAFARAMSRLYTVRVMPMLARAFSSDPSSYEYLAESADAWLDQQSLADALRTAGWTGVGWRDLMLGAVAMHSALKEGAMKGESGPG